MSIKQQLEHWQTLWTQGSDLILLRLRLLRLDANEQLSTILKIIAMIGAMMVLSLVGFISLLFGLNLILTNEWKIRLFFGITAMAFIMCMVMAYWIPQLWRNSSTRMGETLSAMQNDLRALRGQKTNQSEHHDVIAK